MSLTKLCKISYKLCDFLQVPHETLISRADINRAITAYICPKQENFPELTTIDIAKLYWHLKLNPENRDLRDPDNKNIILPDEKLYDLLDYNDYIHKVMNGKMKWHKKIINTNGDDEIIEEKPKLELNFSVLQHLLSKLIIKDN